MIYYLTSIATFSLSRTVFDIFDFEVFRVWPRPLTSKSHLGSNFFITFESPYMTSCLTSMDTISLSRICFRDIRLQSLKGLTLTFDLWRSSGVGKIPTIRKAIYDLLFDFCGHHLSISYRFREIRLQSFKGLTLTFDPWWSSEVKRNSTIRRAIYDFLSRTVLEIMPVKILKAEQNGGFWPFKGQSQKSNFFYHRKGTSTHQTASCEILRMKIGSAV